MINPNTVGLKRWYLWDCSFSLNKKLDALGPVWTLWFRYSCPAPARNWTIVTVSNLVVQSPYRLFYSACSVPYSWLLFHTRSVSCSFILDIVQHMLGDHRKTHTPVYMSLDGTIGRLCYWTTYRQQCLWVTNCMTDIQITAIRKSDNSHDPEHVISTSNPKILL